MWSGEVWVGLVMESVLLLVIPAGALQTDGGLHTLSVSGGAGGAIVQYTTNQDGQFYVPG